MRPAVTGGLAAVAAVAMMAGCHGAAVKRSGEPYLERITSSGDGANMGAMEMCVDPGATLRVVQKIKAEAPSVRAMAAPLTGCANSSERRPDGSRHSEIVCDRAKGAARSYRMVSDGVPGDMRMHTETYGFDPATGAPKTTVRDTHMVRVGACPADLKPGDSRMANGTIIRRAAMDRQRELMLQGRGGETRAR